jgi:hypothetical protein
MRTITQAAKHDSGEHAKAGHPRMWHYLACATILRNRQHHAEHHNRQNGSPIGARTPPRGNDPRENSNVRFAAAVGPRSGCGRPPFGGPVPPAGVI